MGLKRRDELGRPNDVGVPGVRQFPVEVPHEYELELTTKGGAFEVAKIYSTRYKTRVAVDLGVDEKGVDVNPSVLKPTQDFLVDEELKIRQTQIEDGTAEPIIVLKAQRFGRDVLYVIDGHHRWATAVKKGIQPIRAYVLEPEVPFELELPDQTKRSASPEQLKIIKHNP